MVDAEMPAGQEIHLQGIRSQDGLARCDVFVTVAANNRRVSIRAVNTFPQPCTVRLVSGRGTIVQQIPTGQTSWTGGVNRFEDITLFELIPPLGSR